MRPLLRPGKRYAPGNGLQTGGRPFGGAPRKKRPLEPDKDGGQSPPPPFHSKWTTPFSTMDWAASSTPIRPE